MSTPSGYYQALEAASTAYGTPAPVLDAVAVRESNRNQDAVNRTDSNAIAGHPSEGIVQFIPTTLASYKAQAMKANPQAWVGVKPGSAREQLLAASWAMANGHGSAWSTYSKALANPTKNLPTLSAQTTPATTSATPSAIGSTSTGSRFTGAQKAALAMVFDTNPQMKALMGQVDAFDQAHPKVDVVRQTASTPSAVSGGTGQQLVNTALGEIGKTANDAMKYIKAAGGTGKEAWCGDFVTWVFKQRGLTPPPARSVPALMKWAKTNNKLTTNPKPGDLVTFDWNGDGVADHVEMVRAKINGGVKTIGGNTSLPGGGVGVASKNRTSNILGYVAAA